MPGKAALREFYTSLLAAFPAVSSVATAIVIQGNEAASPLHVEGTTVDGSLFVVDNINTWKFNNDGKVVQQRHVMVCMILT